MIISKYIFETLTASLGTAVGGRIYPVVAPAGVDLFPFASYIESEIGTNGTKDCTERDVTVQVAIIAKTRAEAHQLAEKVFPAFRDTQSQATQYNLWYPRFTSKNEQYDTSLDAYVVRVAVSFYGEQI